MFVQSQFTPSRQLLEGIVLNLDLSERMKVGWEDQSAGSGHTRLGF